MLYCQETGKAVLAVGRNDIREYLAQGYKFNPPVKKKLKKN